MVPTLEFSPDAAIHGRLAAGVEKFQPLDSTLPEYLSGVYDASLNWSLFGRTVFDLNGNNETIDGLSGSGTVDAVTADVTDAESVRSAAAATGSVAGRTSVSRYTSASSAPTFFAASEAPPK